ncbi:hypothetical protein SAMN05216357_11037 [Porphyromonadaceae bacterium KH3CP3RA]|nr:hypothetical protein SAMN05216357_11037 [Porphyromonadaceae bacterium KH3CP3RA]
MYNFKGTPGAWQECKLKYAPNQSVDVMSEERKCVCTVWNMGGSTHPDKNEAKANSSLIANSKDLLESSIELHKLHICEQEGIASGMPTPEQWLSAVEKLEQVLNKILNYENQ